MASAIAAGDLVQANGHAGPWKVLEIRQGLALLEHHGGHRLSVRTTTLSVVRKGSPGGESQHTGSSAAAVDEPPSPTLFD
ncbi:hypothetical protein E5720_07115 [Rhodococcus sp. PAMC28707]|uniref:hypothetical protein n=1 Tax=unclassified Rhodococcus (in: high G+C Gram-positive bacteria) TaxID=192944 RepID=UPI00109E0A9C|nr:MULTISPECIES: hypothetical protein [unclassified Rhodococcus (in: high G+C Gram-positive bacteria)]QCB49994.1 hypothetical protein E5769_06900 [Rhodococcus sp. PAMC28705]QCB58311.1 hypothetical protein E5720_07115 [Rhodococcus sp. PAMC28707]